MVRRLLPTLALCAVLAPAASARANEAPETPELDDAAAFVAREVAGIQGAAGRHQPREYTVAMAAAQYVRTRASSAVYALDQRTVMRLPTSDPEDALRTQAGICGGHVQVFITLLRRLGVAAEPAQIFYTADGERQNHVAAEVRWAGHWHFFDVTYGAVFEDSRRRLMSLDEVLRSREPMSHARLDALDPWTDSAERKGGDPFAYVRHGIPRQVIRLGAGQIAAPAPRAIAADPAVRAYDLTLLPDYVGTGLPYADVPVSVAWKLTVPTRRPWLALKVRTQYCPGGGSLRAQGSHYATSVDLSRVSWTGLTALRAPAGATVRLAVEARVPGTPCEVVIDGIFGAATSAALGPATVV